MEEKVMYLIMCRFDGEEDATIIGVVDSLEMAEKISHRGVELYEKLVVPHLPKSHDEYLKRKKSIDNVCNKAVELLIATYLYEFPSLYEGIRIYGNPKEGYDINFWYREVPVLRS